MYVIFEIRILLINWCVLFKVIVCMFNKLKFNMYYYILYLNDNDYDILCVYYNVIKLIIIICIFIV